MTKVFVVHHVHQLGDDSEDVKLIGVCSSEQKAKGAVERLRSTPGFRDTPEGFEVNPYNLDEDNWTEGYVTLPVPG